MKTAQSSLIRCAAIAVLALTSACADDDEGTAGRTVDADAGSAPDSGHHVDASVSPEAGQADAGGIDAGSIDAGEIVDASDSGDAGDAGDAAVEPALPCGGDEQLTCAEGFTCFYELFFDCRSPLAKGSCLPTPAQCQVSAPVCGCDSMTYENPCAASAAGASIRHDGACSIYEPDCILDMGGCDVVPQRCEEGFARTAEGDCHGPCVPIETCRCGGPGEHCPDLELNACDTLTGTCAPLED